MNKTLKNILKVIIPLIIVYLIISSIYIVIHNNDNIKIDEEIEGEYTGYQLTLKASYGGHGVEGQDLGSGTIIKVYNISDNDTFFEPFMGGIWKLNSVEDKETSSIFRSSIILKINKMEEEVIQLEFEDKKYIARYEEEINISSNTYIYDGRNYSYTIKISKEK